MRQITVHMISGATHPLRLSDDEYSALRDVMATGRGTFRLPGGGLLAAGNIELVVPTVEEKRGPGRPPKSPR